MNSKPYITYLPATKPSDEYIKFAKRFDSTRPGWQKKKNLYDVRKDCADMKLHESGAIKDPENCKLSSFTIPFENNDHIKVHRIEYNGSSLTNGAIIECHGGGYCLFSSNIHFGYAEILSKLTGCIIFLLDYKLAPEYVLPYAVNELILLYQYLLNELDVSATKIAMTGDSAGGAMILLALQSMKYGENKYKNLPQPCCVWLNSAWTNLANDNQSNIENAENEVMMGYPRLHHLADWSVGNKDGKLNEIGYNNKKNEIYSPMYGKFEGLCSMYFTAGAKEILLDDTLKCAEKAFKAGVDVRCDIDPYMLHVWPSIVNFYPESLVACSKASDWILQQFKKHQISKRSKL